MKIGSRRTVTKKGSSLNTPAEGLGCITVELWDGQSVDLDQKTSTGLRHLAKDEKVSLQSAFALAVRRGLPLLKARYGMV